MYRGKYEADKRYICVRLGVFFDANSVPEVVDGSTFDYGAQPDGTMPACDSNPGYPWCVDRPNYCFGETSLVLKYDQPDSRECWDNFIDTFHSCSVACKKKLN
ncbi:hypothetical protein AAVH_42026 [Aphelenchoides avenae]|nr:hypothetical protein AAVH_42026 [Aphelenchus avenae]